MEYETVFNVLNNSYQYWWCVKIFSACFGFIMVDQLLIKRLVPDFEWGIMKRPSLYFMLIFLGGWALIVFAGTFSEYRSLRRDLRSGKISVVEGKVEHFKPMPYEGHVDESFTVAGHRFKYSDYAMSSGFNNTASHGGPIREGLSVRVFFSDNQIARLDVAKSGDIMDADSK